jgi:transcriptional regulator with XRE-family HTH domain
MRMSRIYQQHAQSAGYAAALGARIRALRLRAGMTQSELGAPLTRSFVSAVEHGRTLPSLPALLLMSSRLKVPPGELLGQPEWTWTPTYTRVHETAHDPTPRDRR